MQSRVYLLLGIIGVILLTLFSVKPILLKTCIALVKLNPTSDPITTPTEIPTIEPTPFNSSTLSSTRTQPQLTVPTSTSSVIFQGALRVSNPTQYPVRVALLSRTTKATLAMPPVHWDFAPQEGSQNGLQLSLPDNNLILQPGDVLVGFAQDGSRRYWGPYVVGETNLPLWNGDRQEWQLVLQP